MTTPVRPAVAPATRGDLPLELGSAAMRELTGTALERLIGYVESLPRQPAADVTGARELAGALAAAGFAEEGTPFEELLALLFDRAIPPSFNAAGPGYLAFVPGGGLYLSALADLISGATNRYTGVYAAAPALVQLEANVLSWLAGVVGLPATARGLLTSGGSLAAFTAIVTARRERLPEDFLRGTIYLSDQTHHCVTKAAVLAGFPRANLRLIASDEGCRMPVAALAAAVAADRQSGKTPFLVVGNAGTVNTGAVDPLPELAAFCRQEELWFHVDAAYGGFFALTARGRRALAGIGEADSVVLDPHKGLFLPYGTGALLVRDGAALRRAHAFGADYLPEREEDDDLPDFHLLGPELSRPFRGLRLWLPLQLHGVGAFRAALEEKLDLARQVAGELATIASVRLVAEPQLSLLAFRIEPPGVDGEALERLNRDVLAGVNRRQRVFLTGTTVRGRFLIRICVLSFRTHADRVAMALEDLRAAIAEQLESRPSG